MAGIVIPPELADQVFTDCTYPCHVCGATVTVVNTQVQPHRCRIEIS